MGKMGPNNELRNERHRGEEVEQSAMAEKAASVPTSRSQADGRAGPGYQPIKGRKLSLLRAEG